MASRDDDTIREGNPAAGRPDPPSPKKTPADGIREGLPPPTVSPLRAPSGSRGETFGVLLGVLFGVLLGGLIGIVLGRVFAGPLRLGIRAPQPNVDKFVAWAAGPIVIGGIAGGLLGRKTRRRDGEPKPSRPLQPLAGWLIMGLGVVVGGIAAWVMSWGIFGPGWNTGTNAAVRDLEQLCCCALPGATIGFLIALMIYLRARLESRSNGDYEDDEE